MPYVTCIPSFMRVLHILSVCAWLGGGMGVVLLLLIGRQTESVGELQAYNLVITTIDDLLITPGAAGTVATGLLLVRYRHVSIIHNRWLRMKLTVTLCAICFGALLLAPWLRDLLAVTLKDGMAVFDDALYRHAYRVGITGSIVQTLVLLGLLGASVIRTPQPKRLPDCSRCPTARNST